MYGISQSGCSYNYVRVSCMQPNIATLAHMHYNMKWGALLLVHYCSDRLYLHIMPDHMSVSARRVCVCIWPDIIINITRDYAHTSCQDGGSLS